MTTPTETAATAVAPAADLRFIAFKRLGVAPENMRAGEPADPGVPQLAKTIEAAGNIVPLIVRPSRGKKEADFDFMILEGRRRYLAVEHLIDEGRATQDFVLKVEVETDEAKQKAALFLTNTQRLAVHVADAISAIGKMRKAKMSPQQISEALGYDEIEIKRLAKLAGVHPAVLDALRANKINLGHARMFARIDSQDAQKEIATQALEGGYYWQNSLQTAVNGERIDATDDRLILIGMDRYTAAGGRAETDLFGELPAVLLDGDKLDGLWRDRVAGIEQALKDAGLQVFVGSLDAVEGFERPPYHYRYHLADELKKALVPLDAALEAAKDAFRQEGLDFSSTDTDALHIERIVAQFAVKRAEHPEREFAAVCLSPNRGIGLEAYFWTKPYVPPKVDDAGADTLPRSSSTACLSSKPDVETPKFEVETESTHSLHETYTDYATRGLIRALADDPVTALTFNIAQLFTQLALQGRESKDHYSASTLKAEAYARNGFSPVDALDGEVFERLSTRRAEFLASGLRPIPWVAGLAHGERMALLAELMAVTLNVREFRNDNVRRTARLQAAEIAELTSYDISSYWTPDEAFLSTHGKKQLLKLLEDMGADAALAASLKKDQLVTFVAEQAKERMWAPDALAWPMPELSEPAQSAAEVEFENDDETGEDSFPGGAGLAGLDDAVSEQCQKEASAEDPAGALEALLDRAA